MTYPVADEHQWKEIEGKKRVVRFYGRNLCSILTLDWYDAVEEEDAAEKREAEREAE